MIDAHTHGRYTRFLEVSDVVHTRPFAQFES